jgi:hypothetical protein
VKAAVKAMLMNKIGDMFLIVAIAYIVYFGGGFTTISTTCSLVVPVTSEVPAFAGLNYTVKLDYPELRPDIWQSISLYEVSGAFATILENLSENW